jgi:hypothetical protein
MLNGLLERLARLESRNLAGLYLHPLSGLRVLTFPGLLLPNVDLPEARQLDLLAHLERFCYGRRESFWVFAREFTYATCCALHTLVACQRGGRGFAIESTADVLLTSPSTRTSCASRFYGFCRKNERADERTRTADLISYE